MLGAVLMTGSLMAQKPSSDDSNYSLEGMINYDNIMVLCGMLQI